MRSESGLCERRVEESIALGGPLKLISIVNFQTGNELTSTKVLSKRSKGFHQKRKGFITKKERELKNHDQS